MRSLLDILAVDRNAYPGFIRPRNSLTIDSDLEVSLKVFKRRMKSLEEAMKDIVVQSAA